MLAYLCLPAPSMAALTPSGPLQGGLIATSVLTAQHSLLPEELEAPGAPAFVKLQAVDFEFSMSKAAKTLHVALSAQVEARPSSEPKS